MRVARWHLSVILLVLAISICWADDAQPKAVATNNMINDSDILAEYNGGVITRKDLEAKISKIPPQSQGKFRTVEGQMQVLDIMAVEEAFMAKATQMNTASEPDVKDRIDQATRQFLVQEFYKRNITDLLVITEEDKLNYYNNNKQAFYLYPYISISYIQTADEDAAQKALRELKSGKSFAEVSDSYNVNNYVKGLKGVIKNIRLNGNIPGVGNDEELQAYIADSKADSTLILGPFKTSTGWHIFRTNEYIPGRQKDFSEVLPEVEQRARPGVETRMLNSLTDRLKGEYGVVIDTALVARVDVKNSNANSEIESLNLVSSTNPDLKITVKDIVNKFAKLSAQEQLFFTKGEGAQQLLDQELLSALLYAAAKEQNYVQYLAGNAEYEQMMRFFILNSAFKKLVLDTIQVSSEECRAYYDERITDFTSPEYRSIEAVWFDSEKTAERIRKKYARYVKLGDEKRIKALIEKNTTKPKQVLLDNNYKNGIVTGIGPDQAFSDMIWNNEVGYISPVFKSARGDVLFFRILKHTPPTPQNFTEVEPRIYGVLKKQRQDAQQEKITQDIFTEINMVKYPEKLRMELSVEDLFTQADNSAKQRNFKDAITFYDQIIKNFPNGSDDYRASFMKAFIVAEELKDETQALQLFQDFLKKYPTGDLNESAQFMIDTLQGIDPLNLDDQE